MDARADDEEITEEMEVPYPALRSLRAVAAVVSAVTPVLTPFTAFPAPSPASITPAVFKTGKDGGQEDEGNEEGSDGKGKEERLETERLEVFGRVGNVLVMEFVREVPGRVLLQQRLCWPGEQLEHRLFDRAQIQNLHAPELLHPQHFGMIPGPGHSRVSTSRRTPQAEVTRRDLKTCAFVKTLKCPGAR